MGFTFSHPALILPCRYFPKRFYSLSGLIAGSMIPDLEYFIRWNTISVYSHTLKGIFWFDLPLALVCIFIFHQFIRDPLIQNLPQSIYSRLSRFQNFDWILYAKKNWMIILYSVIIGTFTHLFWDSFTSYGGYFVKRGSFLMNNFYFSSFHARNYVILKYFSSVIGLIVLFFQFSLLQRDHVDVRGRINRDYWIFIATVSFPLITIRTFFTDPDDFSVNSLIKTSISSILLATLISSRYYRIKRQTVTLAG